MLCGFTFVPSQYSSISASYRFSFETRKVMSTRSSPKIILSSTTAIVI